jgi:hypothetical protein
MKLFEMEGFLRGKCLPGDMKVNETNAEYLVRKFTELEQKLAESQREFRAADATIENPQMQVEKLAAENAGLKNAFGPGDAVLNFLTIALRHTTYDQIDLDDVTLAFKMSLPETPATDAFLAEVRAQGLEMFAERKNNEMMSLHPDTHAVGSIAAEMSSQVKQLREFAAQLRKGVQP